jgi:hypothetical protein
MRRWIFLFLAFAPSLAFGETICEGGRCRVGQAVRTVVAAPIRARHTVVVEPSSVPVAVTAGPRSVTVVSAQQHADVLAASGSFHHCRNYGGGAEGLGFSTSSPDDAIRRCCFWGQRRPREIATSWCPHRRGYVAVVRYE